MKFARTLVLAFLASSLLAVLAACDSDSPSTVDISRPAVVLSVKHDDRVQTGDPITVRAQDRESGIQSIMVWWDKAIIGSVGYSDSEISKDQVELEVALEDAVVPGEKYELTVEATNGAGLATERRIALYGLIPEPEPGEPGGPIDPSCLGPDGEPLPIEATWQRPLLGTVAHGKIDLEFDIVNPQCVARVVFMLVLDSNEQRITLEKTEAAGVYVGTLDTTPYTAGEYTLLAKIYPKDSAEAEEVELKVRIAD